MVVLRCGVESSVGGGDVRLARPTARDTRNQFADVARSAGVNYELDLAVFAVALVDASLRRLTMLAIILGGLALAMAAAIVVDIATDTQVG